MRRLKGAFAFCVMHQNEPDKIVAVRQNAPLIVGLGKDENYVASDIPAIVGKVRRIIYLNDGEIAVITRNEAKYTILTAVRSNVSRSISALIRK